MSWYIEVDQKRCGIQAYTQYESVWAAVARYSTLPEGNIICIAQAAGLTSLIFCLPVHVMGYDSNPVEEIYKSALFCISKIFLSAAEANAIFEKTRESKHDHCNLIMI